MKFISALVAVLFLLAVSVARADLPITYDDTEIQLNTNSDQSDQHLESRESDSQQQQWRNERKQQQEESINSGPTTRKI